MSLISDHYEGPDKATSQEEIGQIDVGNYWDEVEHLADEKLEREFLNLKFLSCRLKILQGKNWRKKCQCLSIMIAVY